MSIPFATHYNLRNPLFQYGPVCAAVLGAEIQSELIDLSTDREAKIPMTTSFFSVPQAFSNVSGTTNSSITVSLNQSNGPKLEYAFIEFDLPAQYASRKSHCMRYLDLPGLALIESV